MAQYFDFDDRSREKQESRDADCLRLLNGEINAQELARENGVFSSIDASEMRIGRRRIRVPLAA